MKFLDNKWVLNSLLVFAVVLIIVAIYGGYQYWTKPDNDNTPNAAAPLAGGTDTGQQLPQPTPTHTPTPTLAPTEAPTEAPTDIPLPQGDIGCSPNRHTFVPGRIKWSFKKMDGTLGTASTPPNTKTGAIERCKGWYDWYRNNGLLTNLQHKKLHCTWNKAASRIEIYFGCEKQINVDDGNLQSFAYP